MALRKVTIRLKQEDIKTANPIVLDLLTKNWVLKFCKFTAGPLGP